MARKQIVTLTDDLDGSDATQTVRFAYKGTSYEIDLNDKNAAKLDKALAPFIGVARKERRSAVTRHAVMSGSGRDYDPAEVRTWAKEHGVAVSERGRISADVVSQWRAAS